MVSRRNYSRMQHVATDSSCFHLIQLQKRPYSIKSNEELIPPSRLHAQPEINGNFPSSTNAKDTENKNATQISPDGNRPSYHTTYNRRRLTPEESKIVLYFVALYLFFAITDVIAQVERRSRSSSASVALEHTPSLTKRENEWFHMLYINNFSFSKTLNGKTALLLAPLSS